MHEVRDDVRARRLAAIVAHGYRVIRFWTSEVVENLDGVWQSIRAAPGNPAPHRSPLRPSHVRQWGGEGDGPMFEMDEYRSVPPVPQFV
ncbi:MAG: DUF559 domain-containing protein [Acetobacteraceae bacterium]